MGEFEGVIWTDVIQGLLLLAARDTDFYSDMSLKSGALRNFTVTQ